MNHFLIVRCSTPQMVAGVAEVVRFELKGRDYLLNTIGPEEAGELLPEMFEEGTRLIVLSVDDGSGVVEDSEEEA